MIDRCKLRPVLACVLHMRCLFGGWLHMAFCRSRLLLGRWPCRDAFRTTIITCSVVGSMIIYNYSLVYIRIMYYRAVYIYYRCIVTKRISFPSATTETGSAISITIINTAIKTYMRPPIAGMKTIDTSIITPPCRRPQKSGLWRKHPCSRHPKIFSICKGPVTRTPQIPIRWTRRL